MDEEVRLVKQDEGVQRAAVVGPVVRKPQFEQPRGEKVLDLRVQAESEVEGACAEEFERNPLTAFRRAETGVLIDESVESLRESFATVSSGVRVAFLREFAYFAAPVGDGRVWVVFEGVLMAFGRYLLESFPTPGGVFERVDEE